MAVAAAACLPSSWFPIGDLTEDTDDDATISIYSESCIDLTEDSDEDMAPVDLLEDIEDTTPNNENKDLNAEDKQDDVKAPRKNEMYNDEQTQQSGEKGERAR